MHEHTNCILNWRFPRVWGTAWFIMRGLNVVCSTPTKQNSKWPDTEHPWPSQDIRFSLSLTLSSLSLSHSQTNDNFFFTWEILFFFFFTIFNTFLYFLNSYSIFLFPHVFFCYDLLNFELRKKGLRGFCSWN